MGSKRQPKLRKTDLHALIQTLTKSEKKHFKLYSKRYDKATGYLQLFNVIEKQEKYNEEEIHEVLKGKPLLNNLHVSKKYLYESILESLIMLSLKKSPRNAIYTALLKSSILEEKGFHQVAGNFLHTAYTIATQTQARVMMLESLRRKIDHIEQTGYRYVNEGELEELLTEEIMALSAHKVTVQYQRMNMLFFEPIYRGKTREMREQIRRLGLKIETDPYLSDVSKATTPEAKAALYSLLSAYYSETGNHEQALTYAIKNYETLRHPEYPYKVGMIREAQLVNNVLVLLFLTHKVKDMEPYLDSLKKMKPSSEIERVTLFRVLYINQMNYLCHVGEFKKILQLLPSLETEMREIGHTLQARHIQTLYFQISYAAFAEKKYTLSIRYIHQITGEGKQESVDDLYFFSHLLLMMIHIETGDMSSMKYVAKSIYPQLFDQKEKYRNELFLLDLLLPLSELKTKKELQEGLREIRLLLKTIKYVHLDPLFHQYVHVPFWIDSYLENIPLSRILHIKNSSYN